MTISNLERLACFALAVQLYFSSTAYSFVFFRISRDQICSTKVFQYRSPDDPGPPPFIPLNASSLTPPEELPDDIPKDVPKEKINSAINSKERTLYEILGASPDDTRAEIKKKYVEMAKLSHPDAQIGKKEFGENPPDFGEIAAAWRVLGDTKSRKRYDRELQYKQWSAYASKYANEKLEEAVPAVAKIMDTVAIPFIRRTAATTLAVSTAVSKFSTAASKVSSEANNVNFRSASSLTDAFINAIRAGQEVGRAIDSLELSEKSEELVQRARNDQRRVEEVQEELDSITEKRLFATLQSDQVPITSDEAKQVLNRIKVNATKSSWTNNNDPRIAKEIESLEETEKDFVLKLQLYEQTDREWNDMLTKQENAKEAVTRRKYEENEARRRLDEAIRLVSEAKANLVTTSNALRAIEQKVKKNAAEMDRVTFTLSKKQERVRHALRKKADQVKGGIVLDYMSEADLAALRRREMQLAGESEQLARMVARLSSRAEKLKSRADALDRYQRSEEQASNYGESPPWNDVIQSQ